MRAIERAEDFVLADPSRFRAAMRTLDERVAISQGAWRARAAAWRAWRRVPAYREFLYGHGIDSPHVPFEQLPITTKENYIRRYTTEARCLDGTFLRPRVAIDESSGSTGRPFSWVRGIAERRRARLELARQLGWMFGDDPMIALNAFTMGAWATGINVGEALEIHGVVKSIGPDLDKIIGTLEFFGPRFSYFICGYPPFLKLVLDTMLDRGMPVRDFALHALVGGEGMSESFRRYLLQYFSTCFSGYGASDLGIGIAVETIESVYVRGRLEASGSLRRELLRGDHRLPMVFQYNPFAFHIETSERSELIITPTFSQTLSPRIRYNVGDEGFTISRGKLLALLERDGHSIAMPASMRLPLPFLFLYGRRDHTISIMGANIYPEDVERAVHAQAELAPGIASFQISVGDRGEGSVYPRLCIEWRTEQPPTLPLERIALCVEEELARINSDFARSRSEYPAALRVELEIFGLGCGPFSGRQSRIKNRYLGEGRERKLEMRA